MNIKSPEFTLSDTNGQPVSLSEYKGKTIVLYFFRTKYSRDYENSIDVSFDKIAKAYHENTSIVFMGIDVTTIPEGDDKTNKQIRIEKLKELFNKNRLALKCFWIIFISIPKLLLTGIFRLQTSLVQCISASFI